MSLSRRERRGYAKQMGLLSKKESYREMIERFKRANQAGDYLHTHHIQEVKNSQIESRTQSDSNSVEPDQEESINPYGFLGKR